MVINGGNVVVLLPSSLHINTLQAYRSTTYIEGYVKLHAFVRRNCKYNQIYVINGVPSNELLLYALSKLIV